MKNGKAAILILWAGLAGACQVTPTPTAIPLPTPMPSPAPAVAPPPTLAPGPSPTVAPSPTPTSPIGVGCAAPPIPGPTAPFLHRVAEGCFHLHMEANDTWAHDAFEIAAMIGYHEQPACAAFGFALSWKVTAGDGEGILWTVNQQGVERSWKGPQGGVKVGCGYLTLKNQGAGPVDIDVRAVVDVP